MRKVDFSIVTCWHKNENHFDGFLDYLNDTSYVGELVVVINDPVEAPNLSKLDQSIDAILVRYTGRNFSELWNKGIGSSTNDWVLIHAADERFNFDDILSLDFDAEHIYVFKRINLFGGVHYPHCFPIENQERLFKKKIRYYGIIHERLPQKYHRYNTGALMSHFAYDDWAEAIQKLHFYSDLEVRRKGAARNFLRFCYQLSRGFLSVNNFRDGAFGRRWWCHVIKFYAICIIKLAVSRKKNV